MTHVLLVDGQVFQTSAWARGMGRYSLELLRAVRAAWSPAGTDLQLVLSAALPLDAATSEALERALPGVPVTRLHLPRSRRGGGEQAHENRQVLDAHVRDLLEAGHDVTFLSLDVLLGETTAVLPSVPGVPTLLVVYDLIPLQRHDLYLRGGDAAAVYLSRLGELLRADRLLTISRTVAGDLVDLLGVDPDRISVIDGGPVDHGREPGEALLPEGVTEPFVLLPTASDARKNNRRAVMGFARFAAEQPVPWSLVVTSALAPQTRAALARLSDRVVLTGRVGGAALEALYDRASVVLIPSEAEGLGLPLLEAVQRGRRVACSDLPVFREVSATAFATFDPTSVVSIAAALQQAVDEPAVDEAEYARVLGAWSWSRTADAVLEAVRTTRPPVPRHRPRVLVVSARPDGSGPSGPAVQRAHTALVRTADVDYALSADPSRPADPDRVDHLSHVATARAVGPGLELDPASYDRVVVHLDDDPDCAGALLIALAVPATVVLHAPSLTGLWEAAHAQGLVSASRLALERELGDDGLASVRAVAVEVVSPADPRGHP